MTRLAGLVGLVLSAVAASVAAVTPTTQPSFEQLHATAVEWMRRDRPEDASVALEKLYKATPMEERTRPLVLNHAILDVAQRDYVMRAVRDLAQYLERSRQLDERAINLLGAALDVAASDPRVKRGALWQKAFKEWDQRNYEMDEARIGYRRWADQWMTDDEYAQMESSRQELDELIKRQKDCVDRALQQRETIRMQQFQLDGQDQEVERLRLRSTSPYAGRSRTSTPSVGGEERDVPVDEAEWDYRRRVRQIEERDRLAVQAKVARDQLAVEQKKLNELQAQRIRPTWPTKFEPVDPGELTPPPLPPSDPKALAKLKEERPAQPGWPGFDELSRPEPTSKPAR